MNDTEIEKIDFDKKYIKIKFRKDLSNDDCNSIVDIISKKREEGYGVIFSEKGLNTRFEEVTISINSNDNPKDVLKEILDELSNVSTCSLSSFEIK